MPLSPPVVFLNGIWQDNFSQLKSMDLTAYGFKVTSNINPAWIDDDPDNINGSDNIVVFDSLSPGNKSQVVIGFCSIRSLDLQDTHYSSKIRIYTSTHPTISLIAAYSPTSTSDNRISVKTDYHGDNQDTDIRFNEMRILNGGIISNTEHWGISLNRDGIFIPTIASRNKLSILSYSRGDTRIEAGGVRDYGMFDYNTPGQSVLQQASFALYRASNCQIPGMPPFVIWDGAIYGGLSNGAFLKFGGASYD